MAETKGREKRMGLIEERGCGAHISLENCVIAPPIDRLSFNFAISLLDIVTESNML